MDAANSIGAGLGIFVLVVWILGLFLAIVWLVFPFIVWSKLNRIREEMEYANQFAEALVKGMNTANELLGKIAISVAPAVDENPVYINVSRDGKDMGTLSIQTVRKMLQEGKLTPQDHYFDTASNEWRTLETHPALR